MQERGILRKAAEAGEGKARPNSPLQAEPFWAPHTHKHTHKYTHSHTLTIVRGQS